MFDFTHLLSANAPGLWERIAEWYQDSVIHELITYFEERYFTMEFGAYENFSLSTGGAATIRNLVFAMAVAMVVCAIWTAHVRIGLGRFVRRLLRTEATSPESAKTLAELELFRNATLRRELARGTNLRMVVRCVHADGRDTAVGAWRETDPYLAPNAEPVSEPDGAGSTEGEGSADEQTATLKTPSTTAETAPTCCENAPTYRKNANKQALSIDFLTARFYVPEDLKYRAEIRFEKRGSGWPAAVLTVVLAVVLAALLCWLLPDLIHLADLIISLASPA